MESHLEPGKADQRVALITGGSRGLGLAAARSLMQEGLRVAIVGRSSERLVGTRSALEKEFGTPVLAIPAELGAPDAARRIVAKTLARLGRIDTIVASAGDVPIGTLASLSRGEWRSAFACKLFGHLALFREIEAHMRKRKSGVLIAVTGATGLEPSAENVAAGAVNSAVANVMKALANDWGPAGVRVLTVSPGPFLTDRLRSLTTGKGVAVSDGEVSERFSRQVPLGRVGEPWEFGALIRFLQSPYAAYLHGTTIVVDGGKRRAA